MTVAYLVHACPSPFLSGAAKNVVCHVSPRITASRNFPTSIDPWSHTFGPARIISKRCAHLSRANPLPGERISEFCVFYREKGNERTRTKPGRAWERGETPVLEKKRGSRHLWQAAQKMMQISRCTSCIFISNQINRPSRSIRPPATRFLSLIADIRARIHAGCFVWSTKNGLINYRRWAATDRENWYWIDGHIHLRTVTFYLFV